MKQMLPKLKKKTHIEWINHIEKLKEEHPSLKLKKSPDLTGQYVIKSLSDETEGKSVIVTGVGQHQMWANANIIRIVLKIHGFHLEDLEQWVLKSPPH